MELILFQSESEHSESTQLVLPALFAYPSIAAWLGDELRRLKYGRSRSVYLAAPSAWLPANVPGVSGYDADLASVEIGVPHRDRDPWLVVANGRFVTRVDQASLDAVLSGIEADVVAVEVSPALAGYREHMRVGAENRLIGFRRTYTDQIEPTEWPANWPHLLFVRTGILPSLLNGSAMPTRFPVLVEACRRANLPTAALAVGGAVLDIGYPAGLLAFVSVAAGAKPVFTSPASCKTAASARVSGSVLVGHGVEIGDSVVVGPAVLLDGSHVADGAFVRHGIVESDANSAARTSPRDDSMGSDFRGALVDPAQVRVLRAEFEARRDYFPFRRWSWFSYPHLGKRLFDVLFSLAVLIVSLPVFILVSLAIKLSSKGPVFYRARRQGLHGREFDCLKFRSMMMAADQLQEKLRIVNEVDGPQFKMKNDPRVNAVGRFLRETSIDEIPQFINVLLGQMSVVGPRPSPEQENDTCPYWRDARLSVKPGITGMWQVHRTRDEAKDFQEWLYYDTEYVRNLSFRMDAAIAARTASKLINDFVDQF